MANTHWGMVVDLARCVGCQTCTIACKMENGLPPDTLWRTVLDLESGTFPKVQRQFFPMTCMQCADPPCYPACPTTATKVRDDGIVWIDNDICIGCGSCVVACPYQARHLVPEEKYYFGNASPPEKKVYDKERVGICTKCEFCFHLVDEAPEGVDPGRDPHYAPACSSSCIADVILFGDLNNPKSRVAEALDNNGGGVRMLEHLGTQPSVTYLNPPKIDSRAPQLQHTWHKLAVANFYCGPVGVGLYAVSLVAGWFTGGGEAMTPVWPQLLAFDLGALGPYQWAGLLAPLLTLIGLLAVGAEAGRPLRGINVFRNLKGSWMSRESAFGMAFIALALLDTVFLGRVEIRVIAALSGLGAVLAQGIILSEAKGVPAWSVPIMPAYFIVSGLTAGLGGYAILAGLSGGGLSAPELMIAGLVLLLADLVVWNRYLATKARTPSFDRAVEVFRKSSNQMLIVVLGRLVPMLLLLAALLSPDLAAPLLVMAGLAILAGGLAAKSVLILKAAFLVDLFDHFGEQAGKEAQRAEAAKPQAASSVAA